jgi:FdhD protein
MSDPAITSVPVRAVIGADSSDQLDHVAVEEPLQIQFWHGALTRRVLTPFATTMRTPGQDADLVAGFLFAERILSQPADVLEIKTVEPNVVRVELHPDVPINADASRRHVIHSSCGVCGRWTIEDLDQRLDPITSTTVFSTKIIHQLPQRLREVQPTFDRTGGLHAAALFDVSGNLLGVREDVGRHNAVDKLVGAEFRAGRLPLQHRLIFVSGRASFELVQKAVAAGAAVLAAVGAPSSLAVDTAAWFGLTLVGFVREGRFKVYAGGERILIPLFQPGE